MDPVHIREVVLKEMERLGNLRDGKEVAGAIRDAFCDYGGVDNVATGLKEIAKSIDFLAKTLGRLGHFEA